jgi:hypothetical protein
MTTSDSNVSIEELAAFWFVITKTSIRNRQM